MSGTRASESGFRPEIQALRALAVALVVVYHLSPLKLTGGYVGVDVFFVISGYLITSHLVREQARTGRVALGAFWARRIRRLLPAALTVLVACIVFVVLWMPPSTRAQNLSEIVASALYVQNWTLALNSVDYLASGNAPSIVQHYWSLSVEEQFYVAWPLVLLAAFALSRRRIPVPILLALVAGASFAYSVIATAADPGWAYFVTPTRVWEFAVGGLLAFAPALLRGPLAVVASWAGVALIAASALLLDDGSAFPGWVALAPVAGTALVIWAGDADSTWSPMFVGRWAPVQWLGGISYSVYLWHWPILLLYPALRGHEPESRGSLIIIGVTLLLAWATTTFIENPIRRASSFTRGRVRPFAWGAAGMAIVVGAALLTTVVPRPAPMETTSGCAGAASSESACDNRFALPDDIDTAAAAADRPRDWCIADADGVETVSCEFRVPGASVDVALLGDSHGGVWVDALAEIAERRDWSLETYLKTSCPAVPADPLPLLQPQQRAIDCSRWSEETVAAIAEDEAIDLVVYTNAANAREHYADVSEQDYASFFERLVESGKEVLVMRDVPGTNRNPAPACIDAWIAGGAACATPRDEATRGSEALVAAAGEAGVPVFDPTEYICDDDVCHMVAGGVIVYFDSDHLTQEFVETLAPYLGETIDLVIPSEGDERLTR